MQNDIHDVFWRDGFVILRGVFSREEIARFRELALSHPGAADLLSQPGLRILLLDQRILDVVRAILGPQVIYFMDSSVSIGEQDNARFHKDCVDRDDPCGPDWNGKYPIIRVGIYMQEHVGLPGGLDLRRGSHDKRSVGEGEHVYAGTAVGDVVVWNMRTTHSGCGLMLKRGNVALDPSTLRARFLRRFPLGMLKRHSERRVPRS